MLITMEVLMFLRPSEPYEIINRTTNKCHTSYIKKNIKTHTALLYNFKLSKTN